VVVRNINHRHNDDVGGEEGSFCCHRRDGGAVASASAAGELFQRSSYAALLHLYHFAIPYLSLYLLYAAAGLVAAAGVVEAVQAALEFSVAGVDTAPAAEFGVLPAAAVVALVQSLMLQSHRQCLVSFRWHY